MVMSLMGGALIVISSSDHKGNNSSDEYQQAFYVAETGLLEGEKDLINYYMGEWVVVKDEDDIVIGNERSPTKGIPPPNVVSADTSTPCYKSFKNLEETLKVIFSEITGQKSEKDIIFFSPAGASFDSFKNFEDRGYYFNQLIEKYINAK